MIKCIEDTRLTKDVQYKDAHVSTTLLCFNVSTHGKIIDLYTKKVPKTIIIYAESTCQLRVCRIVIGC